MSRWEWVMVRLGLADDAGCAVAVWCALDDGHRGPCRDIDGRTDDQAVGE